MTIYVDNRAGSVALANYIQPRSLVQLGQFNADIEFLGWLPDGPAAIGIEYKTTRSSDIFNSLMDGRLTGTQIPRMVSTYPVRYLLIEGPVRATSDGLLEYCPYYGEWKQVFTSRGKGLTAREYWSRLEGVADCGVRIKETYNIEQSASWIKDIYHRWSKSYEEHKSHLAWDRSHMPQSVVSPLDLVQTSKLPLVLRWARELDNVGQGKAPYLASHFKTAPAMVLADEQEWAKVKWRVKGGKLKGFGKDMIRKIMSEIWGTEGGK